MIETFADYVAGVAVGPTTARSERRSLAIVQAGYESTNTSRPTVLRERFGDPQLAVAASVWYINIIVAST